MSYRNVVEVEGKAQKGAGGIKLQGRLHFMRHCLTADRRSVYPHKAFNPAFH